MNSNVDSLHRAYCVEILQPIIDIVVAAVLFMIFSRGKETGTPNLRHSGVFVLKNQNYSPTQFGYLAIILSFDAAKNSIEQLKQSKYSSNGLISKVISNPFGAELQYIALYFAAHLTFAIRYYGILGSAAKEIRSGSDDGINDLREPDGSPYADDLKTVLMHSIIKYHEAQNKDFDADTSVYQPDSSNVARVFFDLISQTYDHAPDEREFVENYMMKQYVTFDVNAIYMAMKETGLTYQA